MSLVPPAIEHLRDVIEGADGAVEQDYNYLVYRFGDGTLARTYLDNAATVSIQAPGAMPDAVLAYLQARFDRIEQLGRDGYMLIWEA